MSLREFIPESTTTSQLLFGENEKEILKLTIMCYKKFLTRYLNGLSCLIGGTNILNIIGNNQQSEMKILTLNSFTIISSIQISSELSHLDYQMSLTAENRELTDSAIRLTLSHLQFQLETSIKILLKVWHF